MHKLDYYCVPTNNTVETLEVEVPKFISKNYFKKGKYNPSDINHWLQVQQYTQLSHEQQLTEDVLQMTEASVPQAEEVQSASSSESEGESTSGSNYSSE